MCSYNCYFNTHDVYIFKRSMRKQTPTYTVWIWGFKHGQVLAASPASVRIFLDLGSLNDSTSLYLFKLKCFKINQNYFNTKQFEP